MKILIIGAKGMLGQELAKVFNDEDLHQWDREEIDITDRNAVFTKVKALAPDIIINAAAYNAVDQAEEETELAHLVNAVGPKNLAEVARDLHTKFVHYSSDYVFDGTKTDGYTETDTPNPISEYGRSKLAGERFVQTAGGQYYIIRLSRLFGRPALSDGAKKSFVDVMRDLGETKDELQVVNEEVSCPTYAPDLALQTKRLLSLQLPAGIYHSANAGACTWYEFAAEIFKTLNKTLHLIPVAGSTFPRPAKRPAYSELKTTKMPAMRPWSEALREYLNRDNRPVKTDLTSKSNSAANLNQMPLNQNVIPPVVPQSVGSSRGMKGIVLAGGKGTRLYPLTKITSKQLLPVFNKAMVMYPVETLIRAGIKDILIIVAPDHAGDYLRLLGSGRELGVKFTYEIQDEPKGLPEAFIIGENFIGDDDVTMILGDNIFFGHDFSDDIQSFVKGGRIFAVEVPDPERFGVVEFDSTMKVLSIEEKPQQPKSHYAIPGVYIYDHRVINIAKGIRPTWRTETDIVEVHKAYLGLNELDVRMVRGSWYDAGTFESLLQASNEAAAEAYKKKLGMNPDIYTAKK
ncbi:TPA: dTDP-4-dehydrorhamnose reductase [Candidatus Falkowbacteria bacterium]|nr:dTDP-4-dehydrorhamnose reductase [Candidatus Falkowbacteria bacterium]